MHWNNTTGNTYELNGHSLSKRGKVWELHTATGLVYSLGTRASFDKAEALIARDPLVASTLTAWLFARAYDPKVTLREAVRFALAFLHAKDCASTADCEEIYQAAYAQLSPGLQEDAVEREGAPKGVLSGVAAPPLLRGGS